MKPTEKQIQYAMHLLSKSGYPTVWMSSIFKRLGAKSRERVGTVQNWLESMDRIRISELIGKLKGE